MESLSDNRFLSGIKVLEVADEHGEYAGKVLAGLGADVVKIEPPSGEITRSYGPFHDDVAHPDRSLHFWHYNFGKRSLTLDLDVPHDQDSFRALACQADVIVETRPPSYMKDRGLDPDALREANPGLIYARISPFGDDGPWHNFLGSDLVHLALGGIVMNCGYDPDLSGTYDTPPIAPQAWQSYQVAGEVMIMAILGALISRARTGQGQSLEGSVHEAVSKITETDLPDWIYSRVEHHRQTCRHSMPVVSLPGVAATKDGRWILPYRSYTQTALGAGLEPTLNLLRRYGMHADLDDPKYKNAEYVAEPHVALHIGAAIDYFIGRTLWSREIWREAQAEGLAWAPERRPDENLLDKHWAERETFLEVFHDETGQLVQEVGAKWACKEVPWRRGPRAPLLGEHNEQIRRESMAWGGAGHTGAESSSGEPEDVFALSGVRVVDLGWLLASAGAGRFLAALGAEVIKIEHESRPDGMRFNVGIVPEGGRAQRDSAEGPIVVDPEGRLNRSGAFMDINAGKLSASLNIRTERGRELLIELIEGADVLIEGFSPGTLDRLGLSRERLKDINPRLIYAQQSGMGVAGTYGRMRSYGPTAQAFAGLSEMSGLPEPYPPAGIGFSFLDWCGAYNLTTAVLSALFRRSQTGKGCWIDSSQVEAGTYMTGPAVLDFSVNGRQFRRYGNRSPYKLAAPHGIYPCDGRDRWIAVSCFSESQWTAVARTLHRPEWLAEPAFSSLSLRIENQEDLDFRVAEATSGWEAYELMEALQRSVVPAGVCQTAQDRCERDPQLRHLQWLCELEQAEVGVWPSLSFPVRLSATPAKVGGRLQRHGPSYAQDNQYVYGEILGLSSEEIKDLQSRHVL